MHFTKLIDIHDDLKTASGGTAKCGIESCDNAATAVYMREESSEGNDPYESTASYFCETCAITELKICEIDAQVAELAERDSESVDVSIDSDNSRRKKILAMIGSAYAR